MCSCGFNRRMIKELTLYFLQSAEADFVRVVAVSTAERSKIVSTAEGKVREFINSNSRSHFSIDPCRAPTPKSI